MKQSMEVSPVFVFLPTKYGNPIFLCITGNLNYYNFCILPFTGNISEVFISKVTDALKDTILETIDSLTQLFKCQIELVQVIGSCRRMNL